ncbi:MAG: TM0106 family RecB-like putative nuclease [Gammaproteobacteria bacterium]|nr:TM0106 family RecB-like putative nuclease [Gammaproteobacteria bacterium]
MQKNDKSEILFSATDLTNFFACDYITALDIKNLSEPMKKAENSAQNKLLQEKGYQHEANYLALLKQSGLSVCEIPKNDSDEKSLELKLKKRAQLTIDAMQSGVDVIFQGFLYRHPWRGDADFLIKVDVPSSLGNFSYEVFDTKLSKTPEPKHILQLCFYSDLLSDIQNIAPKNMHLILGDNRQEDFKFSDFIHFYSRIKSRFKNFLDSTHNLYPEPCSHCQLCNWKDNCERQWKNDNHLSLVANIQKSQIDKLKKSGINTVSALAALPIDANIPSLNQDVFKRLQSQASLQTYKNETGKNKYRVLPFDEDKGFNRIPEPDAGDLFFDMEGDPLFPNGLEYLFGIYYLKNGAFEFKSFWAHDHDEERATFKEFMDFLDEHMNTNPNAYIYHYNHYETTALKRLSCRYAVAEDQLDDLLRKQKFVDLYKVVRESIRTSESGYSIKNLEAFYMRKRDGSVANAMDSIVVYNQWRELRDEKLLDDIAKYNEIDCVSTNKLRDWLLSIRPNTCQWFIGKSENLTTKTIADNEIKYEEYRKRLLDCDETNKNYNVRIQLADLLEFHRREDKPKFWAKFERQDKLSDELIDDAECLGALSLITNTNLSTVKYNFPPQEYKMKAGDQVENAENGKRIGSIIDIDEENCIVTIKCNSGVFPENHMSIAAANFIETATLRSAIYRVADTCLSDQNDYRSVFDILNKNIPKIKKHNRGDLIVELNDLNEITDKIASLDQSYLFIQGPPGAGKTYTTAHVIVDLMRRGKKIGVSANSHKAIHNLLKKIEEVALEKSFNFSGVHKSGSGKESIYSGRYINSTNKYEKIDFNSLSLISGTAWLFANERCNQQIDYLFIDEAGQVSVANVIAMGTAKKNIILIGDQMQLGQPIQAVHPGEAGLSILEFLLERRATVSPNKGIFLGTTYRLHPKICRFISDAFYDGRLGFYEKNIKRRLAFSNSIDKITNEGLHTIGVSHSGCSQKSEEEAVEIKKYYLQLLHQKFVDQDGIERAITHDDILVVTPYNVQVNHLKSVLPKEAKVSYDRKLCMAMN